MREQGLTMRNGIRILTLSLICIIGIVWGNEIRAFALTTDDGYEYKFFEDDDGIENIVITGYSGKDTDIIIPNKIDERPVTSIGDSAFWGCSELTSITIPDNVTSIGDWAFSDCSELTSIIIPNSVTSIGDWAFSDCDELTSITFTDDSSLTSIGYKAFFDTPWLEIKREEAKANDSFVIVNNILIDGGDHLYGDITIPDGVTSIGGGVFYECTSLTSITIPDSVTSIGNRAFEGCSSLTGIAIPDGVTSIGEYAFWVCSSLKSITIPESVTSIGDFAFADCSSLKSITIPKNVASIGGCVFAWCDSLATIVVDSANLKYDSRNSNAIIEKSSNTLIVGCAGTVIPDSVTSIGDSAFDRCMSLTSIIIPESVTSIGNFAFYCCINLTDVTIKNGETSIAWNAFEGCSSKTMIHTVEGSSVEKWAKDNNLLVEVTPKKPDTQEKPNTPNTSQKPNTSDTGNKEQAEGEETQTTLPKVGKKVTVSTGIYKVTKSTAKAKEVTFTKPKSSKKTSLTIPSTVKIGGQIYKVTEVSAKAFKNNKKLKTVTIGKNVKKIGKEAFFGCKKLKKITIKSTVLKSVGKNALKNIYKKATIKCPKKQLAKYKKLFKSKTGYKKTMKIKK